MSKEIKEKCKECVYYNCEMEYPDIKGTTTHSNCISRKCEYRKETKDLKIRRLTSKVADLEAKLAVAQNDITDGECIIHELKQQLAEKETDLSLARNEINTLKHNLNVSQEHDKVMCEQYFEKCKETNQDKISFAVEKLEQIKKFLYSGYAVDNEEIEKKIDNQIKQLKEGK